MNLNHMRCFVAVAEEMHFGRAARRLFLTQQAVSTAVRKLERALGVRLFDRTTRRVELTEAGAAVLPEAQALLAAADRLLSVAGEERVRSREPVSLKVGLFLGALAASDLTGPILSTFRAHHPDVHLQLVTFDLDDPWGAARPDLDVLLYRDRGMPSDTLTPLFEVAKHLVVDPGDELADAEALSLADIDHRRWAGTAHWPRPAAALTGSYVLADHPDLDREPIDYGPYSQVMRAIADRGLLATTGPSAVRLGVLAPQQLVARPLLDVPASVASVAVRRPGPVAAEFAGTAARVAADLIALVPEARSPAS